MRECTNEAIKMFASSSFNTELSNDLGLTGYQRITSSFIIDKKGQIVNIRVRAPHPQLKDEAIRVINLLPKMKPGKVNGKAVSVSYLLPIIFKANPIKTYNDSISNSNASRPYFWHGHHYLVHGPINFLQKFADDLLIRDTESMQYPDLPTRYPVHATKA